MLGSLAGIGLCHIIKQDIHFAAMFYSVLTGMSVWSAFACVKSIPLCTLNNTRLQVGPSVSATPLPA